MGVRKDFSSRETRDFSPRETRDFSPRETRVFSPTDDIIDKETERQYYEEMGELVNQDESTEMEAKEQVGNITTNIGVTSKQEGYLKQQGKQDNKYTKVHEKDQQEVKPAEKVKLRSPKMVDRPVEESRGVEKVE